MRSEEYLPRRALGVLGVFLVVSTLQFVGVQYIYRPLVLTEPVGQPLVPRALGFALSMALLALFFDWVSRQMRHPVKAAMTVAISQILLVDVDYVLSGERTVAAGAASALVLLVSWGAAGLVYRRLLEPTVA
jgi:hypothetical protein